MSSQLAFIKTQQEYTQNKSRYPLLYHSTKQLIKEVIAHQSQQRYTNANNEIEKELKQQQSIKQHRTIPKCHRPKPLYIATSTPTTTSELSSKFVAEYETMFFQQLERAITHNTITLEINRIRQETIVLEIEKLLIISKENPAIIKHYYNDFMNTNNIPVNHQPCICQPHSKQSNK